MEPETEADILEKGFIPWLWGKVKTAPKSPFNPEAIERERQMREQSQQIWRFSGGETLGAADAFRRGGLVGVGEQYGANIPAWMQAIAPWARHPLLGYAGMATPGMLTPGVAGHRGIETAIEGIGGAFNWGGQFWDQYARQPQGAFPFDINMRGRRSSIFDLSGGYSENIEDRRLEEDSTRATKDLTEEIRKLNDRFLLGGAGGGNLPGGVGGGFGAGGLGAFGAGTGAGAPGGRRAPWFRGGVPGGGGGGVTPGAGTGPWAAVSGMEPMAPAGSGVTGNLTTVTSPSGRKFQVASEFAENFQGFINDYEKAGGVIGSASGGANTRDNPSYHPLGRAIDINQTGYGIRGGSGTTLPQGTEEALAYKWGLYPGSQFRSRSDIGHFEVRNRQAAAAALAAIRAGTPLSLATAGGAGGGGGMGAELGLGNIPGGPATTTPASWYSQFSGNYQWRDLGDRPGSAALRVPDWAQGIALPRGRGNLGGWFNVRAPNGQILRLQQTDIGPSPWTGKGIDISARAAEMFGYSPRNFPTGGQFQYAPTSAPSQVANLDPRMQAIMMARLGPGAHRIIDAINQVYNFAGQHVQRTAKAISATTQAEQNRRQEFLDQYGKDTAAARRAFEAETGTKVTTPKAAPRGDTAANRAAFEREVGREVFPRGDTRSEWRKFVSETRDTAANRRAFEREIGRKIFDIPTPRPRGRGSRKGLPASYEEIVQSNQEAMAKLKQEQALKEKQFTTEDVFTAVYGRGAGALARLRAGESKRQREQDEVYDAGAIAKKGDRLQVNGTGKIDVKVSDDRTSVRAKGDGVFKDTNFKQVNMNRNLSEQPAAEGYEE